MSSYLRDTTLAFGGGTGRGFAARHEGLNKQTAAPPAGTKTVSHWRAEVQADFARRVDWMQDPSR